MRELIKSKDSEQAIELFEHARELIDSDVEKDEALLVIVEELVKAKDFEQARKVTDEMGFDAAFKALLTIAEASKEAKDLKQAKEVAAEIIDLPYTAAAYRAVKGEMFVLPRDDLQLPLKVEISAEIAGVTKKKRDLFAVQLAAQEISWKSYDDKLRVLLAVAKAFVKAMN